MTDKQRIERLAAQVEKLSWMCEWLSDTGLYVEDAEKEWEDVGSLGPHTA